MEGNTCYYCGMVQEVYDHTIPNSKKDLFPGYFNRTENELLVPCCDECNRLLVNTIQETLKERKQELKRKLIKKYKGLYTMPTWREYELKELGSHLQNHIRRKMLEKKILIMRLNW